MALGKILSVDLRRNFLPHFAAAVIIMTALTMLMGISALNARQSAQPVELIMPIVGVILLTPVFLPEQNENIRDVIRSKKTDYIAVCIIRVIYSVFFLALICGVYIFAMHLFESEVTVHHFIGGYASGLFLGAMGFLIAGVSKNVIVGYMAALIYYTANFVFGNGLIFDLFTMSRAVDVYNENVIAIKYLLMAAALLMIILCFVIIGRK